MLRGKYGIAAGLMAREMRFINNYILRYKLLVKIVNNYCSNQK